MVRAGKREQGLQLVANGANEPFAGYYELKPSLKFERGDDPSAKKLAAEITWPTKVLSIVDDTILYTDDDKQKYRLPIGNPEFLKQRCCSIYSAPRAKSPQNAICSKLLEFSMNCQPQCRRICQDSPDLHA